VTELVRIPFENGESVLAEVDRADVPGDAVVLAAPEPGRAMAQVSQNLEVGLRSLRPALAGLVEAFRDSAPDSVTIEFGIKLGGETGVILAKGTAEVNFKVDVTWTRLPGAPSAGLIPCAEVPHVDESDAR
jgi:hypothetical protein